MKAKSISAIDRGTVHRICSGQVVLTLATAVKELVENSVDAGATNVEIKLKEYGSETIEVSDNGSGVDEVNFEGLALKNHTSKLQDFSDLVNVETFGFRGEALSSLCALSNLTVTTCHESAAIGTRLEFDHRGKIQSKTPCPRLKGTTVSLHNLFYTLPVRHKEFQRNLKKEFAKMIQVLNAYCLITMGVRLKCSNQSGKGNRSVVISTNGNRTLKENISNIFGSKQTQSLLEVTQFVPSPDVCDEYRISYQSDSANKFRLEGFISKCQHGQGRSSTDRQFFFINSRPCDSAKFSKLVNEVYHMYNRHQYPFVILHVKLDREGVDVNVTPDKRQIFLEDEKLLLAVIKTSLMKLFEPTSSIFQLNQPITDGKADRMHSRDNEHVSNDERVQTNQKAADTMQKGLLDLHFTKLVKSEDEATDICSSTIIDNDSSTHVHSQTNVSESEVNSSTRAEYSCPMERENCSQEFSSTVSDLSDSEEFQMNSKLKKIVDNKDNMYELSVSRGSEYDEKANYTSMSPATEVDRTDIGFSLRYLNNPSSDCGDIEIKPDVASNNEQCSDAAIAQVSAEYDEHEVIKRRERLISFSFKNLQKAFTNRKSASSNANFCRSFRAKISPIDNNTAEEELQREIKKEMFSKMEILGQFNLGFIVTRLGDDLFIVDQHATDEKYNFEMLQRHTVIQNQKLIQPQTLELTASNECIVVDNLEIFNKNGFDFLIDEEALPTQRVKLVSAPVSRNWHFGKEDVEEIVFMLTDLPGVMCRPSRIRQMFASRSCRKSVMIGTALSKSEMKKLICHMGEIEQPWNCPHGRPTMRHLINLNMLPR